MSGPEEDAPGFDPTEETGSADAAGGGTETAGDAPGLMFRNPETEGFGALCQKVAASTGLEILIIAAIVTNTLILCVQNPANQFDESMVLFLTVMDLILSVIFTLEMLIRIRAMGFLGHRGYLDVSLAR